MAQAHIPAGSDVAWRDPIVQALERIRAELLTNSAGAVADYIPQLSSADPSWFGLALASLEGHVYRAGEADVAFTIQSISKPFVLALAVSDLGTAAVAERVGAEPSGEAFNAISLEPGTGRPANPMVNAGAIVTSSLIAADGPGGRFERIRRHLSDFAGHELEVDEAVFASERATADRNRALGYLMRNAGSLSGDIDEVLDVYFRQCSLLVTAGDLAVMAATLANGGINPVTGVEVTSRDVTAHVLSIMATCGMYDYAGQWLLRVGLPAKSGVSGGLVAASPGQFGIGLFSPPLDEVGNSVRAVAAGETISERFGLHLMRVPSRPARPVYLSADGREMHSSRTRRRAERLALETGASAIEVRGIGGDLEFAEAEILVRSVADAPISDAHAPASVTADWLVLDLHRVTRVHPAALKIIVGLLGEILDRGVTIAVTDPGRRLEGGLAVERFASLDEALEWCEDSLLSRLDPALGPGAAVALLEHDVLAALDPQIAGTIAASLETRQLATGEGVLTGEGELVVLVLSGRLGVYAAAAPGQDARRAGSLGPGTAISRVRLVNRPGGAQRLHAELPSTVAVLRAEHVAALESSHPGLTGRLWMSMTQAAAGASHDTG